MSTTTTTDGAVTLHMFIRPGTPHAAAGAVVAQLAELFEFGIIGPGSSVWCNIEIPNALWILSDRATLLRIVDVPTAGWVRMSSTGASWGNVPKGITKTPGFVYSVMDTPIPAQHHDLITIAFRNADTRPMRAIFGGGVHEMVDYEITRGGMRAIDFKIGGVHHKGPLAAPTPFDANYAAVRGLDLMAATTGAAVHKVMRENLEAFTTVINIDEFDRIRAIQQRMAQVAEVIADPIIHRIAELEHIGPYRGYGEEEPDVAE